ncbi:MAG: PEP-CTERM sorting domain-containing protein [Bryobacteraceae bacterium]|nr:PEP-CTERM sorting domain-containing protein [Bryobacteraceae bacterium]
MTAVQPLQAVSITNYYFTGTCSDCEGTVTGTLVLQGYTPGNTLDFTNFVSFTYDGSNLLGSYVIVPSMVTLFVGNIPANLPGPGSLVINTNVLNLTPTSKSLLVLPVTVPTNPYFVAFPDGSWETGTGGAPADQGTGGSFSLTATPEPSSVLLLGAGLAALGLRRRRG